MKEPGRTAAKSRLKEGFRASLLEELPRAERACNAVGAFLSRAEVLRAIRSNIAECVARAVRDNRLRGEPTEAELIRVAMEAFNEVLDELIERSTQ